MTDWENINWDDITIPESIEPEINQATEHFIKILEKMFAVEDTPENREKAKIIIGIIVKDIVLKMQERKE